MGRGNWEPTPVDRALQTEHVETKKGVSSRGGPRLLVSWFSTWNSLVLARKSGSTVVSRVLARGRGGPSSPPAGPGSQASSGRLDWPKYIW